jgi:hypothetical protein
MHAGSVVNWFGRVNRCVVHGQGLCGWRRDLTNTATGHRGRTRCRVSRGVGRRVSRRLSRGVGSSVFRRVTEKALGIGAGVRCGGSAGVLGRRRDAAHLQNVPRCIRNSHRTSGCGRTADRQSYTEHARGSSRDQLGRCLHDAFSPHSNDPVSVRFNYCLSAV